MLLAAPTTTDRRITNDLNESVDASTRRSQTSRSGVWWASTSSESRRAANDQTTAATTYMATEIDEVTPWLFDELKKLETFKSMPQVWESTGAARPNQTALVATNRILFQLSNLDLRPTHVDPSTDEGVCISFRRGARYADIECFNNGLIFAVISEDDAESTVWVVPAHASMSALSDIRSFIYE